MICLIPRSHSTDLIGLKIDQGRLRLVGVLGCGAYGVVYSAKDRKAPKHRPVYYAVKCLQKAGLDKTQLAAQYSEIELHAQVSGKPHVLRMHRVVEDKDYLFVVLDLAHGGDLFDAIITKRIYHRNDYTSKKAILQLIDGLSSCHQAGVFHRDLKPENILCGKDGFDICVADFGLATDCRDSRDLGVGSPHHMSPEARGEDKLLRKNSHSPEKSDIWSLGVLILNILTGLTSWERATLDDPRFLNYLINPNALREVHPISLGAASIIKRLLAINPDARMTLPELREAIVKLDTFFLTDAELSVASPALQKAARYEPAASVYSHPLPPHFPFPTSTHNEPPIQVTIAALHAAALKADVKPVGISTHASSGSSASDSEEPITPETRAVDLKIEIPNFSEGELDLSLINLISDDFYTSIACSSETITSARAKEHPVNPNGKAKQQKWTLQQRVGDFFKSKSVTSSV